MRAALIGCFAALSLTACQKPSPAPNPLPEIGRYVIIHSPHVERDTMLLDTVTGRTWVLTAMTYLNGDPLAWQPVPQLNTDADRAALDAQNGKKPPGAKTPSWIDQNSN